MPPAQRVGPFWTSQPGKGIWSFYALFSNMVRLPFWFVYFLPRSLRQDSRWSFRQALCVRIARAFLQWSSDVEIAVPWDLSPGAEKDQWVTLPPADSKYFTGVTVADPATKPSTCGGTWYPAPLGAGEKPKRVVLHFHGGAFVVGDGRKQDTGFLTKTLLDNTKKAGVTHVFCPQYHLAANPGGRFPAALQDAITAYAYLLNKGIKPEDIIVSGDSAGANLALSLLRYLADHGDEVGLPNPDCAWLWSPWVNPAGSLSGAGFAAVPQASTDYLNSYFGEWGASTYAPAQSTGLTLDSEYINFQKKGFKTSTRLYFSVGENEALFNDVQLSYSEFSKIPGNKTDLRIEPAAVHDIILVGYLTGFEKEAADAAKRAAQFVVTLP